MLNLFYEEPDPDRWITYDRYPRRIVRRLVYGPERIGGQKRVFVNLCSGLERLGVPYRVNHYRHAQRDPSALVCIIGKPFVLNKIAWRNPILFGASGYSHPVEDLDILNRLRVQKILVPGAWMEEMCRPYWGDAVQAWPVGIDTDRWRQRSGKEKTIDVLLYDKVRWDHQYYEDVLISPIRRLLTQLGHTFDVIRYGAYREEDFESALMRCRSMIFLCEHETQGIAYQQALSMGVPILAWDRGGPWQDPDFYPHKVVFAPVTSVPYWDERCGEKFVDNKDIEEAWSVFWGKVCSGCYSPRDYILENLTLEKSASNYLKIVHEITPG